MFRSAFRRQLIRSLFSLMRTSLGGMAVKRKVGRTSETFTYQSKELGFDVICMRVKFYKAMWPSERWKCVIKRGFSCWGSGFDRWMGKFLDD